LAKNYPALKSYIASIGVIHSKAMMAYLTYIAQRIIEMHRILKYTGSLYLHCDPTASHYMKGVLDEIFGDKNFRNEIIWCYKGGGSPKNDFGRRHDIIFRYSKSNKLTFNADAVRVPYESLAATRTSDTAWGSHKGVDKVYRPHHIGKIPEDWWQIDVINSQAKERTGYPTQKPLALLKRIIEASSNEGDIVMDPFCGCATTCVAAQQLGRKWIGIDIEKQARNILIERLSDEAGMFTDFAHTEIVPHRTDIQLIDKKEKGVKERLYKEQNGICNGCKVQFNMRNMEVDHIIPESKGGGSYYENYQLLCSACNKMKGNRPMEYLLMRWDKENEFAKNKITFGR
jgi:site-specific DNA-methyltransferase (adenine-specific)